MVWHTIKVDDEVKEKIDSIRGSELREGKKKSINDVIDEGIDKLKEEPENELERDFMDIF